MQQFVIALCVCLLCVAGGAVLYRWRLHWDQYGRDRREVVGWYGEAQVVRSVPLPSAGVQAVLWGIGGMIGVTFSVLTWLLYQDLAPVIHGSPVHAVAESSRAVRTGAALTYHTPMRLPEGRTAELRSRRPLAAGAMQPVYWSRLSPGAVKPLGFWSNWTPFVLCVSLGATLMIVVAIQLREWAWARGILDEGIRCMVPVDRATSHISRPTRFVRAYFRIPDDGAVGYAEFPSKAARNREHPSALPRRIEVFRDPQGRYAHRAVRASIEFGEQGTESCIGTSPAAVPVGIINGGNPPRAGGPAEDVSNR